MLLASKDFGRRARRVVLHHIARAGRRPHGPARRLLVPAQARDSAFFARFAASACVLAAPAARGPARSGRPAAARERPHEVHRHPFLEIAIRILEIEGFTAVSDDEDERRVENVTAPEPRLDQSFDSEGRRAVAVAAFSRRLGGGRRDRLSRGRLVFVFVVRGCRLGGRVVRSRLGVVV